MIWSSQTKVYFNESASILRKINEAVLSSHNQSNQTQLQKLNDFDFRFDIKCFHNYQILEASPQGLISIIYQSKTSNRSFNIKVKIRPRIFPTSTNFLLAIQKGFSMHICIFIVHVRVIY